jgi:hypothetical protein
MDDLTKMQNDIDYIIDKFEEMKKELNEINKSLDEQSDISDKFLKK